MAASSTYPASHEQPSFPPMPRRQSCDRCHEQKVRCITQGHDGVPGLGAIAEEDETTLGKQVVADIPCVRCSKAGAVCIFSPQLRSGRPRVHKAPASASSRQRRSRQGSSRCSSSSPSMSPGMSPAVSQSSSPRSLPLSFTPGHLDYTSVAPSLAGSPAPIPQYDPREQDLGDHTNPDHWLLSTFDTDGAHFLTGSACHPPQYPTYLAEAAPSLHDAPFLTGHMYQSDATPTAETVMSNHAWGYHNLTETDASHSTCVTGFEDELAQINLRIHQATQTLSQLTASLLSLSSPAVNEVFDASCSFVNTVDRYAARRTQHTQHAANNQNHHAAHAQPPRSTAINDAKDTSLCLTILASHQLVLGAFEFLCSSLAGLQVPTSQSLGGGGGGGVGVGVGEGNSQQILAMANLVGHLLSQLDRSVGSLALSLDGGFYGGNDDARGRGRPGPGSSSIASIVLYQCERRLVRVSGQVQDLKSVLSHA
ncbi:hypothetical protein QBC44DRAFT_402693 [Cladorrhinum sp. PSN332]|nr:hypothetical protein QBC44DRAFT_402693 [Cladorrhinum sp. PSN332]